MSQQPQLTDRELKRLKKRARPLWKKKRFFLPVGFIVLIVLIAIIGISSNGGGNSAANHPTTAPGTSASSGNAQAASAYKVGQTFKVGEYQVKVNKVTMAKTISALGGASTDKANGEYYIVNVTLTNLSNTASTVDSSLYNLEANGNKYSSDTNASMDANISSDGSTNNDMFLNELNPGVTMSGNLVFDVPASLTKGVQLNVSGGFTSTDSANVQLN